MAPRGGGLRPRAGEIRGHKQLRRLVLQNQAWLAERHARIETLAATCIGGRAVVEVLAHLVDDGVRCALEYAARMECWRRPASTKTSKHPSSTPEGGR